MAVERGFHHIILDIRDEFGDYIIDNFVDEYLAGRTPNPCVLCNRFIKWGALLKRADKLGCDFIATGHYAQVRKEGDRYLIEKADGNNPKNQAYALALLTEEVIKRSIFPLGKLKKEEVREIAKERGFAHLAKKPESYEICFIPDNNYQGFLKKRVEGLEERLDGGEVVLESGEVVGKHRGYPFYTVGQRKGLGLALGYPVYVTEIQPDQNRIVVGTFDELARGGRYVNRLNMMKYPSLTERLEVTTQIRYNDPGRPSIIEQTGPDQIKVYFGKGVHAIAPGQLAVFYEGPTVIGSGFISRSFQQNRGKMAKEKGCVISG